MSMPAKIKPESVVNAYLFYAQRLLNLMSSATLTEHKADQMAITASACLSLKQAWQAWLEELSVYVGQTIPDYAAIFLPENSAYPEVEYLVELSKQQENWLSQLMPYCEPRLNISPPASVDIKSDAGQEYDQEHENAMLAKKISLLTVDNDTELSDQQRLSFILKSFKNYIQAVRGRQAEW